MGWVLGECWGEGVWLMDRREKKEDKQGERDQSNRLCVVDQDKKKLC